MANKGIIITIGIIVLVLIVAGYFIMQQKNKVTNNPAQNPTIQTNENPSINNVPKNAPAPSNPSTPSAAQSPSQTSGDLTLDSLTSDSSTGEQDDSGAVSQETIIPAS